MSKYLITGVSGFVARHFIDFLRASEESPEIMGLDVSPPRYEYREAFEKANLLDYEASERAVRNFSPDFIIHLASFSSVAKSWERPSEYFSNNTNIFLNLLEIIRGNCIRTRLLSVGSSEEYGIVREEWLPLREDRPLGPVSPYAVARVAQEQLSLIYAKSYGLDIVITRSFNHLGIGQEPVFAIPSFAKQLAEAPEGQSVELGVGDLSIVRDYLDVRDVARAYYLLLHEGEAGEIYNICGGIGHSMGDILGILGRIAGKEYRVRTDQAKLRPTDNMVIIGDHSKLTARTGWKPSIGIKESLMDVYADFLARARA